MGNTALQTGTHLCDLSTLVIPSNESDSIGIPHLSREGRKGGKTEEEGESKWEGEKRREKGRHMGRQCVERRM